MKRFSTYFMSKRTLNSRNKEDSSFRKKSMEKIESDFNVQPYATSQTDSLCKNPYKRIMRLPLKFQKAFGLYHKKKQNLSKAYSILVLVILWLNTLRIFSTFDSFYKQTALLSIHFQAQLLLCLWNFLISFQATIFYLNQELDNREKCLITQFNYLFNNYLTKKSIEKHTTILSKNIHTLYVVGFIFSLANAGFVFFSVFYKRFSSFLGLPFSLSLSGHFNMALMISVALVETYATFYWNFAIVYFWSHCMILTTLFDIFNKEFKDFIRNSVIVIADEPHPSKANVFDSNDTDMDIFCKSTAEKKFESEEKFEFYR